MYAKVLVQYGVKALDHTFTYHIPDNLKNDVKVGMKVYVPFGNQKINGFVVEICNECENFEIKDIISVINKDLQLNDELLKLGEYISKITLCSKITSYQTMLPTSLKINNSKDNYDLIKTYIKLNKSIKEIEDYINNNKKSKKQNEILSKLIDNELIIKSDISGSSLNKLLELNLVKEYKINVFRINPHSEDKKEYSLTKEQQYAYNLISEDLNKYQVFLLHGVTGSGKTEVYMHLAKNIVESGKCVIMLVPEISLTTQIVRRFYNRFGDDVAVFHSNLSDGEKYDEYNKIKTGKVHIVVGTRSAIFTPINNLGLIIIDEEHSSTYKQENNPRYHVLDIAKWRGEYHNCPIILGSATPSLETMARAKKGVYKYITLQNRVGDSNLPNIKIVDMAPEYRKGNMILSDDLSNEIMNTLGRHEQVMLLLNRRGYSTIITCASCGYTYKCPYCDITLTYHKSSNNLRCHYCGYTVLKSDICPNCNEKALKDYGLGTEKIEQFMKDLYPSYNIIRMDTDTTSRKGSLESIIKSIENHEYDIIIGTQMISKGFDFPKVTLVGIINADESLNIPDFRSGENTYNLLSQVSGRAGRSSLSGNVIIQTFNPDNKTLNFVAKNDYIGNYNYEMSVRKILKYPPYYYLIGIKVASKNYDLASKESRKIVNYLNKNIGNYATILGPTTASMFRINNIYRFQIIIKYRQINNIYEVLKFIDEQYILNKEINIEIDINPIRI